MSVPQADIKTPVLGWHDSHNAGAALVAPDGRILYAAAEERFTRKKLQKGYPQATIEDITSRFNLESYRTCYADMPLGRKIARNAGLVLNTWRNRLNSPKTAASLTKTFISRALQGRWSGVVGTNPQSPIPNPQSSIVNRQSSIPYDALCEHHTAHAATAYYLSGFNDADVVTVDGVGECLSGTVFSGRAGRLTLKRKFYYNELTVGADYETLTAMLGFNPDRHCGKITGLAAYGRHNNTCIEALSEFFERSWRRGSRNYFDRLHGSDAQQTFEEVHRIRATDFQRFSREDLAYAIQHIAEQRVLALVREHVPDPTGRKIALAGGVFANVRINQKIKELGFSEIFIAPPMDDGGLSLGAALYHLGRMTNLPPQPVEHMFLGPDFSYDRVREALDRAGIKYERVNDIAGAVAALLAEGKVIGRFDGPMEFGPRALGNRSILYDTRDPSVNSWLNKRLKRTEFMPFAPATIAEAADRCYKGLDGCRHTAEFMTITFDCTDYMKEVSPAVVHVDGTARAQLVRRETNPGLYEIIHAYHKITGIPSVVNTSFNMHEAPIIATPEDAVRTFQDGRLDYLAIGPFLASATTKPLPRFAVSRDTRQNSELRIANGE
ncbi:MAG: carbamoyltransferase C-terminal domain-containing protein [Phycisphaerae bacterium]